MEQLLHQACITGNVNSFLNLTLEHANVLDHKLEGVSNTVLHLAARYGHAQLAAEILRLRPEMVKEVNGKLETPLHVACKGGNTEVVEKLVEFDCNVVYMLNSSNESGLLLACLGGNFDVAKRLLDMAPKLLDTEEGQTCTSLHAAAERGNLDIVREITKLRPDFSYKRNSNGQLPIHLASRKGQLEVVKEFLKADSNLDSVENDQGRNPLQLSVIKGKVNIIREILSKNLELSRVLTEHGESLLHLAVKNNQFGAVKYLVETVSITEIINSQDSNGNTILHLATESKLLEVRTIFLPSFFSILLDSALPHAPFVSVERFASLTNDDLKSQMVNYLVSINAVTVNVLNNIGFTPLDLAKSHTSTSETLLLVASLLNAGGKLGVELREIDSDNSLKPGDVHLTAGRTPRHFLVPGGSSLSDYARRNDKQKEFQVEGFQNARNTIIIVAVLIATVSFTAGVSPPGGVNSADMGMELRGKSVVGQTTAFKVFTISNEIALFASLAIVVVLVTIIPFERKELRSLLVVAHKAMWVCVSFMAVTYVAAMWIIIPRTKGTVWIMGLVLAISGGTVGVISIGLGVVILRRWIGKEQNPKEATHRNENSTYICVKVPEENPKETKSKSSRQSACVEVPDENPKETKSKSSRQSACVEVPDENPKETKSKSRSQSARVEVPEENPKETKSKSSREFAPFPVPPRKQLILLQ